LNKVHFNSFPEKYDLPLRNGRKRIAPNGR
jgi:hypothetical protein